MQSLIECSLDLKFPNILLTEYLLKIGSSKTDEQWEV